MNLSRKAMCVRALILWAAVTILWGGMTPSAAMAQEEKTVEGFPSIQQRDINLWSGENAKSTTTKRPRISPSPIARAESVNDI